MSTGRTSGIWRFCGQMRENAKGPTQKKTKRPQRGMLLIFSVLFAVSFLLPVGFSAEAYIMPAEQLLDMVTRNFSKMVTLIITQSTHLEASHDQEGEIILEERLWMKSPGFFHTEVMGTIDDRSALGDLHSMDRANSDVIFRKLLLAGDAQELTGFLIQNGVDVQEVSYSRFNGKVVFRFGDSGPESAVLLVDKDRFLPLFFRYRRSADPYERMVGVTYEDYRKLPEGWYPYEITYMLGQEVRERYFVLGIEVNLPVDHSGSETTDR
jgi:hypothetical protein